MESLEEDFPDFRNRVGKRHFARIAQDFLARNPSRFSNLAEYSEGFEPFARVNRKRHRIALKDLDLARRDWLKVLLFVAAEPDRSPVPEAAEVERYPERMVLVLNPLSIFQKAGGRSGVVLWRSRGRIGERRLNGAEWKILRFIGQSRALSEVITRASDARISASEAGGALRALIADGIVWVERRNAGGNDR